MVMFQMPIHSQLKLPCSVKETSVRPSLTTTTTTMKSLATSLLVTSRPSYSYLCMILLDTLVRNVDAAAVVLKKKIVVLFVPIVASVRKKSGIW